MKSTVALLKSPAIISLILVFPFMLLEFVNRQGFEAGFPILLFGILWLLPIVFIVLLKPILQNKRMILASPLNLFARVVVLILLTWLWTSMLADQLPCFMGVPNCD